MMIGEFEYTAIFDAMRQSNEFADQVKLVLPYHHSNDFLSYIVMIYVFRNLQFMTIYEFTSCRISNFIVFTTTLQLYDCERFFEYASYLYKIYNLCLSIISDELHYNNEHHISNFHGYYEYHRYELNGK